MIFDAFCIMNFWQTGNSYLSGVCFQEAWCNYEKFERIRKLMACFLILSNLPSFCVRLSYKKRPFIFRWTSSALGKACRFQYFFCPMRARCCRFFDQKYINIRFWSELHFLDYFLPEILSCSKIKYSAVILHNCVTNKALSSEQKISVSISRNGTSNGIAFCGRFR